ncbi:MULTISPECIES: hypothetical protein [unclassified Pedobacter]|uniref:hypothetical protein n=1 Tax=unclassified Pedobacter TaxID=2628915 RepID=UPI001DDB6428|nr:MULTISPECIES: hypothetical protein [unclassified Pedobacter]CAH0147703.1 hypothetical protein SRABI126_00458 [Pedobacter sp. Bi126]CAH0210647.1 hypothetical protein SRABI36_02223 [Pedobacter sp. Bi36]
MKITLDTKSLLLGFLGAGLMFTAISFKNGQDQTGGRYRTEVNANNLVVILDTETGNYIIGSGMQSFGKVQWIKGEFDKTFSTALDNKKEPK